MLYTRKPVKHHIEEKKKCFKMSKILLWNGQIVSNEHEKVVKDKAILHLLWLGNRWHSMLPQSYQVHLWRKPFQLDCEGCTNHKSQFYFSFDTNRSFLLSILLFKIDMITIYLYKTRKE